MASATKELKSSILFSFNLCLNLNNHTWLAATILGSTGLGNKVQTPPEHTKFLGFSLYVSSVKILHAGS